MRAGLSLTVQNLDGTLSDGTMFGEELAPAKRAKMSGSDSAWTPFVGVHDDAAEAQRMRDSYIQRYARSTVEHYQFADVACADIEGYEHYARLARNIERHGLEKIDGVREVLPALHAIDVGGDIGVTYGAGRAPAHTGRA